MPRILYIEDNRDNRLLVRRVLMAADYDFIVVEAESALKGIDIARTDPPDLILMDLSMPEMDGLTATQRLRNFPELNHIPIVALTANAMQGDKERTLGAGCDGYISKPIDVDKIADEVFRYLNCRAEIKAAASATVTLNGNSHSPAPGSAAPQVIDAKVIDAGKPSETADAKTPSVAVSANSDAKAPSAAAPEPADAKTPSVAAPDTTGIKAPPIVAPSTPVSSTTGSPTSPPASLNSVSDKKPYAE